MIILKSLIVSKLIYVASVLPVTSNIIKQTQQKLFKFLWNGPDKVTRKSTFGTLETENYHG